MRKYKYVLLDLDGTLIYSHLGIFSCFRKVLQKRGLPSPTDEELKKCVGPSLYYSFKNFFDMTDEEAWAATREYREEYGKTGVYENEPIEGAIEALQAMKTHGYILALATSKPQPYAEKIAQRLGFVPYLSVLVGCGFDGSFPTKADVVEEAMRRLGARAEECLMVGDRKYDIEGAREKGVDGALLKIGYGEEGEETLCNPDYVFNNFADLTAFLSEK